jgi:hypothetical protein
MEPERDPATLAASDGRAPRRAPSRLRRLIVEKRPRAATGAARLDRVAWFFVALGMIFRLVRYAQNLPLWSDECFLAVNFVNRGYLDLLHRLDNGQIAPVLFLWAERAAVGALGFSEWSLRLAPIACGLASVFLFERLARATLRGIPRLLAVGAFAVSVHPIRHAAEAKPYAFDLLAALLLLAPAISWLGDRGRSRPLWLLAGLTPLCLAASNPSLFVLGGIVLTLAGPVVRSGRRGDRLALATCLVLFVGLSAVLHLVIGREQSARAIGGLQRYWASGFAPVGEPWKLPGWLLSAFTGGMMAYPGGGARGLSTPTFVAFAAGAAVLNRGGKGRVVACLVAPLGLAFLASAFHRYPFGTEARLMQFAAPAVCLLAGAGAGAAIEGIRSDARRRRVLAAALVGFVACGVIPQVVSAMAPYRMRYDRQAREFARRFWPEQSRDAELACAHLDFGIDPPGVWRGRQAWYLCNQAIYSPQRREHGGPRLGLVSADRPLRCVVFERDPEDPAVSAWLGRMNREYDLRSTTTLAPVVTLGDPERRAAEHWRIYDFIPRSTPPGAEDHVPMETSHDDR